MDQAKDDTFAIRQAFFINYKKQVLLTIYLVNILFLK